MASVMFPNGGLSLDRPSWWASVRARLQAALRAADRRVPLHLSQLVRGIADRDLLTSASSLAFYGLVSALPLLLIAFALMSAVTDEGTLQRFAEQVSRSGPEGTGQFVDQLVSNSDSLTLATLVFTLWPATAYGGGLRRTLARYSDGGDGPAPALRGRMLGLSLVLVLPVLVLAGVPLMFFLSTLSGDGPLATALGWTLALVAGTLTGTMLTTLLYHAFSPGDLGLRESLRGAALTAVVTGIFSLLFVVYLEVGNTGDRFGGGTMAMVVLLGVWLFVANILLLAGHETVVQLHEGATPDPRPE